MKQYEIEPTLFFGSSTNKGKKGKAPVYLLDLVSTLRDPGPSSSASGNPIGMSVGGSGEGKESVSDYVDRLELALHGAEGMVRRKAGFGSELRVFNLTFVLYLKIRLMKLSHRGECCGPYLRSYCSPKQL